MNARLLTRWLALCAAAMALLAHHALAQPNPPLGPPDTQDGKTFRVLAFHDVRAQVRSPSCNSATATSRTASVVVMPPV